MPGVPAVLAGHSLRMAGTPIIQLCNRLFCSLSPALLLFVLFFMFFYTYSTVSVTLPLLHTSGGNVSTW